MDHLQDSPDEETEEIDQNGDVLLLLKSEHEALRHKFRCSRHSLRRHSHYLRVLFDPEKFNEGITIEQQMQRLRTDCPSAGKHMSASLLPVVTISALPILSMKQSAFRQTARLLLLLLSDSDSAWPFAKKETVERIAQLLLLSEVLDAVDLVKIYLERHGLASPVRVAFKSSISEKEVRQRCLIGLLLDHHEPVELCSASLVVKGSKLWTRHIAGAEVCIDDQPAWNNLPFGIEEELQARRQYAIDTLTSIQTHFVATYSRERQCKKGYSNSLECDSFHLGEMVKFFTQKGCLTFRGVFTDHESATFEGNLGDLMTSLKRCPSYQLDPYHAHCGVRQRLMPIIERVWPEYDVGICLRCWKADSVGESWLDSPSSKPWAFSRRAARPWQNCTEHARLKAMYTASERNWTPSEI